MAARLDSFGLAELAAKSEDAFRLAGLAMAEGARVAGYRGDYYRYRMGDAVAVIRTMNDPETGQEELLGMDTHAASTCVWECQVVKDVTPAGADPMSRRVLVRCGEGEDRAVVDLVCPEVLPSIEEGTRLRLGMAAFPLRVSYDLGESSGVVEAQQDTVLLQGVVKDAKVGETFLGMEPLTKFLSVTVSTRMGDVELCHPIEMVPEAQKDHVRPGAVVSAYCVLSGDVAVGIYAGGLVFGEEPDLQALAWFFQHGGVERLRPVLRSDCAVTFLENRQEGLEHAMALLELVRQDLGEAGLTHCAPGTGTSPGGRGRRLLLLGDGKGGFAFLCRLEVDSLGRVRELSITNDPSCEFDLTAWGE